MTWVLEKKFASFEWKAATHDLKDRWFPQYDRLRLHESTVFVNEWVFTDEPLSTSSQFLFNGLIANHLLQRRT